MKTLSHAMRILLLLGLLTISAIVPAFASDLIITIDPGHGGGNNSAPNPSDSRFGIFSTYNGQIVFEKNLNLAIAKAMKEELQTYKNVKVYLTRSTDKELSLTQRVSIADRYHSDLLISVHNNASDGSRSSPKTGSCVLVSSGRYYPDLAKCETSLANLILAELKNGPGTANRGLLKRLSSSSRYPNGARADYYGLIRNGTIKGIPTIIVEHAFVDSKSDYTRFLSTPEKLKSLGIADATAIAKQYGLTKKDGSVSYTASGSRVRMISKYWMLKDGKYYYVKSNGSYKTGWFKSGGYTYYLTKSGAAATGLHTYTKSRPGTYYFTSRGRMVTGWRKISGNWYYFRSTGKAVKNTTYKINGKKYQFNSKGVCTNK